MSGRDPGEPHRASMPLELLFDLTFGWLFQVVIGTLTHTTHVTPAFAAFTVAIPVAVSITVLALLATRSSGGEPATLPLTLFTAALILAAAAATPILTLLLSTVIMVVLVALLLAHHLTAAHRASGQPGPLSGPQQELG
jgi:hypothetical protein